MLCTVPYAAFLLVAAVVSVGLGIRAQVFRKATAEDAQLRARRKAWITSSLLLVASAGICAEVYAQWGWLGVVSYVAMTAVVIWLSPNWSWGRRQGNDRPG